MLCSFSSSPSLFLVLLINTKTLKSGHPPHHNCHHLLFLLIKKNLEKLHDSFCFSLDLERPDDFLLWDYVAVPLIENISVLSCHCLYPFGVPSKKWVHFDCVSVLLSLDYAGSNMTEIITIIIFVIIIINKLVSQDIIICYVTSMIIFIVSVIIIILNISYLIP